MPEPFECALSPPATVARPRTVERIAPPVPSERRTVDLATGRLQVSVDRSDLPLDELCGFAARRNPKRGFLFVSKVLGRHIPARPAAVRRVHRLLAGRLSDALPGPIVVIGMAETAIGLGQGLFEEYLRRTGRRDVLFLHTTRYRLQRPLALEFLEEHSHAAQHRLYAPAAPDDQALLRQARTVVLVDDEASSGRTMINLSNKLSECCPHLQRVVAAVITDWRGRRRALSFAEEMPVSSEWVSLLEGEYCFEPHAIASWATMPDVAARPHPKDGLLSRNDGRLGVRQPAALPARAVEALNLAPHERLLVLGTGEFVGLPFLLAEACESAGARAFFQATTRSPATTGLAIGCGLTFRDNYGDGMPNYVYNVRPVEYDRIVVCYETPRETAQPDLLAALGAEPLFF